MTCYIFLRRCFATKITGCLFLLALAYLLSILTVFAITEDINSADTKSINGPERSELKPSGDLPSATASGIVLDANWKKLEYKYAREHVIHPAWGLAHAERDYRNAISLAEREKMHVDKDVLFAAAYLHDLGGIGSFQKEHVDHAVRSAELAEPLLRDWGFPMDKWTSVKETILCHVYYSANTTTLAEAIVFHDADCLDFLGDIGIARLYAASSDLAKQANLADSTNAIVSLQKQIPAKLITSSAKKDSVQRVEETNQFLKNISHYNYDAKAF